MRTLVLGGTAWVGRTVAETARDLGHDVVCLARGSAPFPAGVEVVRGDRSSIAGYDDLRGSFDRVVDVARHPGQVRTAVTALAGRVGCYALVSTGNVYADHARLGATEDEPLLPALVGDEMPAMERYGEAKVACEQAAAQAGDHLLARAGLIGGPGDPTGRGTYWPWRFAQPSNPAGRVLVPDAAAHPTQVVDVRDLASWLLTTDGRGAFNVVGEVVPLADHLEVARSVAGHDGPLVPVSLEWLTRHEVEAWAGARSLPMWAPFPGWEGFTARSNARAKDTGLVLRPLAETLRDALATAETYRQGWTAGLSDADERALLAEVS